MSARMQGEDYAEGWAKLEADKHAPEYQRGSCTCGFCAWSAEHVVVMVLRSMFEHCIIRPAEKGS